MFKKICECAPGGFFISEEVQPQGGKGCHKFLILFELNN